RRRLSVRPKPTSTVRQATGAAGLETERGFSYGQYSYEVGKGFVVIKGTLRHLRANTVAYVALSIALSGTSYAAATKLLPANSVGTHQVINHSLLGRDFKAGQLPREIGR